MGDRLEAQINAIENIQEECKHDIREVKEHLARLTRLLEDHIKIEAAHPRGPSPLPNRQVPQPFIQTTSYLSCGTNHPNLRQPMSTVLPAFMATSRPVDQPSSSKGELSG